MKRNLKRFAVKGLLVTAISASVASLGAVSSFAAENNNIAEAQDSVSVTDNNITAENDSTSIPESNETAAENETTAENDNADISNDGISILDIIDTDDENNNTVGENDNADILNDDTANDNADISNDDTANDNSNTLDNNTDKENDLSNTTIVDNNIYTLNDDKVNEGANGGTTEESTETTTERLAEPKTEATTAIKAESETMAFGTTDSNIPVKMTISKNGGEAPYVIKIYKNFNEMYNPSKIGLLLSKDNVENGSNYIIAKEGQKGQAKIETDTEGEYYAMYIKFTGDATPVKMQAYWVYDTAKYIYSDILTETTTETPAGNE